MAAKRGLVRSEIGLHFPAFNIGKYIIYKERTLSLSSLSNDTSFAPFKALVVPFWRKLDFVKGSDNEFINGA